MLCKPEDLTSNLQCPCERLDLAVLSHSPSIGGQTGGPQEQLTNWFSSLVKRTSFRFSDRFCHKAVKAIRQRAAERQLRSCSALSMPRCTIHPYTLTCATHTHKQAGSDKLKRICSYQRLLKRKRQDFICLQDIFGIIFSTPFLLMHPHLSPLRLILKPSAASSSLQQSPLLQSF